jgi:hypothetical protein
VSWSVAGGFDHSAITATCFSCHNGTTASGKGPAHVPSANTCEDCHTTASWIIAGGFDHSTITATCFSCHNGTTASGKGPTHVPSANTCDDCHDTRSWSLANFDHSGIIGGCGSCHNGTVATGEPLAHFVTSLECDECHSTIAWQPIQFTHRSPNYSGDHAGQPDCNACHLGDTENVPWPFGAYKPDCAGCHANDFKAGPHKKYENPDVVYTVGELRDCTGACHIFTDSTLTTIKKRRSGEHRVNRGDW